MRGLPKGRGGGKEAGNTERKREKKGGEVTFKQCRQEVMTQFSIMAVNTEYKHGKRGGMTDVEGEREGR